MITTSSCSWFCQLACLLVLEAVGPGLSVNTEGIETTESVSAECYTQADGADYRGTVSTTVSGKTCQKWTSQTPYAHHYTPARYPEGGLGEHNYCRNPNPDDAEVTWCYTTNRNVRWEYCYIGEAQDSCTVQVVLNANTDTYRNASQALSTSTSATSEAFTTNRPTSTKFTTETPTNIDQASLSHKLLGVFIEVPASLAIFYAFTNCICVYKYKCRKNPLNHGEQLNTASDLQLRGQSSSQSESNMIMTIEHQQSIDYINLAKAPAPLPRPVDAVDITWNDLFFRKELGSGEYGQVWLAETKLVTSNGITTKVAIKSTKEGAPVSEKENLLREWNLMKKFTRHRNVVQLLGGCFEKDQYYVILEYLERGPLNELLKKSHPDYAHAGSQDQGYQQTFSKTQLMMFANQVADGMEFVSSNKCVHRDLAARNVLVSEGFICKVSDFGLARDREEYHRLSELKLPIRWMALELLVSDVHTTKSDVWSFGILFWEIITLGAIPYPGLGTMEVVDQVKEGYRMPKPKHCLEDVYDILLSCWATDPEDRPSFQEISERIQRIIELKEDYLRLDAMDKALFVNTEVNDEDEKV